MRSAVSAKYGLLGIWCIAFLASCASSPPRHTDNICDIFDEKNGWYKDAARATKRWNIPIAVNMSFMYQESRFRSKAKPGRTRILWVIPGPRKSNAYGYAQAKTDTWKRYKREAGSWGADRDDFDDAIDFIAWYNRLSANELKINPNDAKSLYLAYHEGRGGFRRRSYAKKRWLIKTADQVAARARRYQRQLSTCEKRLHHSWWPF